MVKRYKHKNLGTVSHATMRTEDLIPAFIDELRYQTPTKREHLKLIREIEARINQGKPSGRQCRCVHERESYWQTDEAQEDLSDLFDALNCYCPPYFYFGAHPGDGSDYGYWLPEGWEEDFDGLKVAGLDEVPRGYTGEVLQVIDHGNITLYAFTNGRGREVWGLV